MELLVKQLAIPLSNPKTVAKWLVIAIRPGYQAAKNVSQVAGYQGERLLTQLASTRPVRAECLAQQGISKHARGSNCGFQGEIEQKPTVYPKLELGVGRAASARHAGLYPQGVGRIAVRG